jgi:Zn-dependent metalloprotease
VTTHWCLHRTLDYYDDVHGRNSYDDNGHNVDAYNNALGSFVTNACWSCNGKVLEFGEGPTTSASDDVNSMDVVGHEFTHAVTEESADLEYEKQSGALNESFSDIFGTVIENFTGAGVFDWTLGEEPDDFRTMSNPKTNGDPTRIRETQLDHYD